MVGGRAERSLYEIKSTRRKREWCSNYTVVSPIQDRLLRSGRQEWIKRHGDSIALAGEENDIVTCRRGVESMTTCDYPTQERLL